MKPVQNAKVSYFVNFKRMFTFNIATYSHSIMYSVTYDNKHTNLFLYPRCEVYRGYIVFAFSVIIFVPLFVNTLGTKYIGGI